MGTNPRSCNQFSYPELVLKSQETLELLPSPLVDLSTLKVDMEEQSELHVRLITDSFPLLQWKITWQLRKESVLASRSVSLNLAIHLRQHYSHYEPENREIKY